MTSAHYKVKDYIWNFVLCRVVWTRANKTTALTTLTFIG